MNVDTPAQVWRALMPRVGITGHMNLTGPSVDLVRDALARALSPYDSGDLVGISCLAEGADSIFADTVLRLGGRLEVVLPASDYRERKVKPRHADTFDRLIGQASKVHTMPFLESNRSAYEAANNALLATSEQLIAVWDGQSPADQGGTAAVVQAARSMGVPVDIVWPAGAARQQPTPPR